MPMTSDDFWARLSVSSAWPAIRDGETVEDVTSFGRYLQNISRMTLLANGLIGAWLISCCH